MKKRLGIALLVFLIPVLAYAWGVALLGSPGGSAFRFTITTAVEDDTFTLPIYNGGTYDFAVNWGDGNSDTITAFDDAAVTHTYADSGATTYTVSITGIITGFRFNSVGDRLLMRDIKSWGPLNVGNNGGYFYGCSNLTISATDVLDLTNTFSMASGLRSCSSLTTIPSINSWGTSNITTWTSSFRDSSIDQDFGTLDITSVTDLSNMFNGVTLSTANYSSLLVGWEGQNPNNTVIFGGGNSKWSGEAAADARNHLVLATGSGGHSWTITDGGEDLGTEKVTNGTFTANLTGWINDGGSTWDTFEQAAGKMHLVSDGTGNALGGSNDDISVEAGKTYRFSFDYDVTSGVIYVIRLRQSYSNGTTWVVSNALSGSGTIVKYYIAPTTENIAVSFFNTNAVAGDFTLDNISVKETPAP